MSKLRDLGEIFANRPATMARSEQIREARRQHDRWLAGVLRASLANATAPEIKERLRAAIRRCGGAV
jgi:hypothetical protein